MVAPERRVVVKLPSYREVMEEVKVELIRLVGEKVVEFQAEQFAYLFGKPSTNNVKGYSKLYAKYRLFYATFIF